MRTDTLEIRSGEVASTARGFDIRGAMAALALFAVTGPAPAFAATETSYTLFEAGQVRPLALSTDGKRLYAVNTPDNRVEIFCVEDQALKSCGAVAVGLEPVAVAVRNEREVWVVNHLSDSISIVDVRDDTPRVVRTLLVGDEPRDIVFGGRARDRAFVTTAHRGQNVPYDPQLTTPGIGRADVWVFDANKPGDSLSGLPLTIITLFTDTPRALAVSADGTRVYAAGFLTGNRTTTVFEDVVTANGGLPEPRVNFEGNPQPPTGLIVKYDGEHWADEIGRYWDSKIKFSLPDTDVFVIDAAAALPVPVAGSAGSYAGVGTVIFNMAVNPVNGRVYVANTEALNERRFEGPGEFAGQTVRGHLHETRISVLSGGQVLPRHLNKHIDYSKCCEPVPNDESRKSLAFPMGMTVTRDGQTLYVAAFGSSKIGVFDTAALENDSFAPSLDNQITVSGGGPSGIVLDEKRGRLYALTRFDNSISVIDTRRRTEVAHVAMFNPEPPSVVQGRRFLYDAALTSSHGDSACASCHVFGDFDALAWDLGDPDTTMINNPGPFTLHPSQVGSRISPHFAPLKGPMATQSLRGMANHGPMHWRGDRTGGNDAPTAQPDSGTFDELAAFLKFNPAFVGLNGRHAQLTSEQMQAFADFILQVTYPPNPIRNLDNSLTPDQQAGHDFYFGGISDTFFNCNACHVLDPNGNAQYGVAKPGFFGTDGQYSFENEPQVLKIPHLRNMYQKVGMFGMPRTRFFVPESFTEDNAYMGDQVRGFGFFHDGSTDTLFRFHGATVFVQRAPGSNFPGDPGNPGGFPLNLQGLEQRRQMEQFMLAFDSNLAPIVGQQVTLTSANKSDAGPRLDLLMAQANLGACELVAKTGKRGYLYTGNGLFKSDRSNAEPLAAATLRERSVREHGTITYTCVPPGSGVRMAIDRDEDGHLDGDERQAHSDPADAASTPSTATATLNSD